MQSKTKWRHQILLIDLLNKKTTEIANTINAFSDKIITQLSDVKNELKDYTDHRVNKFEFQLSKSLTEITTKFSSESNKMAEFSSKIYELSNQAISQALIQQNQHTTFDSLKDELESLQNYSRRECVCFLAFQNQHPRKIWRTFSEILLHVLKFQITNLSWLKQFTHYPQNIQIHLPLQ